MCGLLHMSASALESITTPELELETFRDHLMWILGTKFRFSARATCTLKHGATSWAPSLSFYCSVTSSE